MREIKFRAWDKEKKVMMESFAHIGKGGRMYTIHHEGEEPEYEVMQYTGLKDRKGKEVYEGDICENGEWEEDAGAYHYTYDVVEWDNDNARWLGWNYNENELSCGVIGNIYENPELLNKLSK